MNSIISDPLRLTLHLLRKGYHRFSGGLRRTLIGEPAPLPWMLLEEADIVSEILTRLQPRRCLEYGAAYSTLHFPRLLPSGASWTAVEHVDEWADIVETHSRFPENASILRVAIPSLKNVGPVYTDDERFAAYVAAPNSKGPFDFILVDGRARNACVSCARKLLRKGGVVILHDANRPRYRDATAVFEYQCSFLGRGEDQLGIWVGRLGMPVEEVLDVRWHRRVSNFCERIHHALNIGAKGGR